MPLSQRALQFTISRAERPLPGWTMVNTRQAGRHPIGGLGGDDLLEELRPRDFARERTAVGNDQQDRDGNPDRKDRKRDGASQSVVAWTMAMATSAQSPWSRIAGPFDRADRRLADDNTLTPRLERAMQIADDLALHCPLGPMRGL